MMNFLELQNLRLHVRAKSKIPNPVSCGKCIAKLAMDREDHDPRTWQCASLVGNVGYACNAPILTGSHFKKEMEKKIKKEVKDISDPAGYAEDIWQEIKAEVVSI